MENSQYIVDIIFNIIECTCTISLTNSPEQPIKHHVYVFFDVGNIIVNRYHNPEFVVLGDFYGFEIKQLSNDRSEVSFDTGDSVVIFESAKIYDSIIL